MHESLIPNGQTMDPQERIEFRKFKEDLQNVQKSIDKLVIALIGSELTNDRGMVGRVEKLEEKLEDLESELENIRKDAVKQELYVKILWLAAGVIATAIFNVFLKH